MGLQEVSSLAIWRAPKSGTPQEVFADFLAFPRMPAAARRLSQNMLALAAQDRAFDGIVKDVGRFTATGLALYLHSSGGITLPRLKELSASTGFISPGRARAILLYLRFLRYVTPVENGDSRITVYVPTPDLLRAWQSMVRVTLDAVAVFEPGVMVLSNRLGDPAVIGNYIRIEGEFALSQLSMGGKSNATWRVILNRHAGTQILHALMLAGKGEDYPPRGAIPFSLTQLAKTFHVSRPHVARMLKAGEREGLLTFLDENTLQLTEVGRSAAMDLIGIRLCFGVYAASRLHEELENAAEPLPA